MARHFHIKKQSRRRGQPSQIVEHTHSLRNVIANHEHEGMIRFATSRKEIERLRDEYDAQVAAYQRRLRGDPVTP